MDPSPLGQETLVYESHSMRLDEFATYLGHRFPRCALIEEVGYEEQPRAADNNSDSNDLLIPGQLVVVTAEKNMPTLQARVEGPQQALLSIPLTCMDFEVALLPPNDPEASGTVNRSWERTFTSVSEILDSDTLPSALNILRQCHSYEKRPVEAGVILFNIKTCTIRTGFLGLLQREGIQGTSVYGTKCTFLTGTRVLFSSRQCDTKCTLRECAEVIEYPQEVTVFLKKGVSREFPQLKNLGTLTLTGKEEKRYLVVSKAGGSKYDKLHTLPLDSSMKITAVRMESCEMQEMAKNRQIKREHRRLALPLPSPPACPDEEDPYSYVYHEYAVASYNTAPGPPLPTNPCPARRNTTCNGSAPPLPSQPCPRRLTTVATDRRSALPPLLSNPCPGSRIRNTDSTSDEEEEDVYSPVVCEGSDVGNSVPLMPYAPRPCPRRNSTHSESDEEDLYEVADEELYTYDEDVYEDFDVPEKLDDHPQDVGCTNSASTQLAQPENDSADMYSSGPSLMQSSPLLTPADEEEPYIMLDDMSHDEPLEPLQELNEEPSDEALEESNEEPSDKPLERPHDEPCDEPLEEPSEEPSDKPLEQPYDEPSDEPLEDTYEEPSKDQSDELYEKPDQCPQDLRLKKSATSQLPQPDNVAAERDDSRSRLLHSSTLPTRAACRPTEQQLFHHVARRLGAEWKRFAIYLGFRHSYVQQADKEDSFENKVFDILVAWRNGMGNKSKSWATILEVLENAELGDLASEIKTEIEEDTLYCSNSYVH